MHAWINITHPGFSGRQDMPDDGDQWVSWEQIVAQLRKQGEADGRAALLAREVVELRGEVAKLKPLESMRSRLCAALGLPADSAPETVAEALNHTALVGRGELSLLRDFAARRMGPRESDRLEMTQDGYAETLRALRANQGGAAT